MKKRIEKVVRHYGGLYASFFECDKFYYGLNNDEGLICMQKEESKVVSEREVLEFGGLSCYETLPNIYAMRFESEIDLTKYNIKVIATPKENPLESKSREELIEIINELKSKE